MKNNKTSGEDKIQTELLLKKGGKEISFRAWKLIFRVFTSKQLTVEWKIAEMCPIHKKGNKHDWNNYREIASLNVTYNMFTNCILLRLKDRSEETLGDYQGGFKPRKLTVDQISILRQLLKNHGSLTRR